MIYASGLLGLIVVKSSVLGVCERVAQAVGITTGEQLCKLNLEYWELFISVVVAPLEIDKNSFTVLLSRLENSIFALPLANLFLGRITLSILLLCTRNIDSI